MIAHELLAGTNTAILVICDHASAEIPPGIRLGVPPETMATHVALDIGVGPLASGAAALHAAPAILGRWSRLVADTNRPPGHAEMAPLISDGIVIPGNKSLDRAAYDARLALHGAFHDALDRHIAAHRPTLIVSIHSFTPALVSDPAPRPWPVALLWNRDDRAIAPALAALEAETDLGGPVGCNEPYSGQILNYTMDRHAEGRGIPYVGFEVRQDLLETPADITRWANVLARAIGAAHNNLARSL